MAGSKKATIISNLRLWLYLFKKTGSLKDFKF